MKKETFVLGSRECANPCHIDLWLLAKYHIVIKTLPVNSPQRPQACLVVGNARSPWGRVSKKCLGFINTKNLRACLAKEISSLNFRHSSLITHHSSLNFSHPFGIITQFLSLNIFHTIYGPHTCHCVRALLFCYPRNIFIPLKFLFSHFPFPFSHVTLPNLEKFLKLPRLVNRQDHHH